MKIFFDTEFTGLHKNTTLISIGMIAEDGREFYRELNNYDTLQINDWLQKHVISNLENSFPVSTTQVRRDIMEFLEPYESVEFWGDVVSYDWILFREIWEKENLNLPNKIHYIPLDIATAFKLAGLDPDLNREEFSGIKDVTKKHNALWDAKVIKACFMKLLKYKPGRIVIDTPWESSRDNRNS